MTDATGTPVARVTAIARGLGHLGGDGVVLAPVRYEIKTVDAASLPQPRQGGRDTVAPAFGRIQLPPDAASDGLLGRVLTLRPAAGAPITVVVTRMLRPLECLIVALPGDGA